MITIFNKKDCCGCTLCEQVCNKGAISMQRDETGFLYPVTDATLCNNCGLCERLCPILQDGDKAREPLHTFAVKHKDEKVRMSSSSGGAFSVLAEETILSGGVVYGAVFNSKWNVEHTRIDSIYALGKLRGSKYVQSDLRGIFSKVRKDVMSGIPVLFSGTPCQVAALHSYLRKPYSNLTTVDFVCHGVPNPRIWEEFLKEEIKSMKINDSKQPLSVESAIKSINFRDKSHGWVKFFFKIVFNNGKTASKCTFAWDHTYMRLFLKDFIARPSCHSCRFRCGKSGADYTLGDYWAGTRFYPHFFDDKGVSMLLSYGRELPESIMEKTDYIETTFDSAKFGNPALTADWPRNPCSGLFYFCHDKIGMRMRHSLWVADCCLNLRSSAVSFSRRQINRLKRILKRIIGWQK